MIVIAIDAGYGTGISWYSSDTGEFATQEVLEFLPACSALEDLFLELFDLDDVHVVAESFIITQNTARLSGQNESLRLNGVAEWLAYKLMWTYSTQSPGARKSGEAKLKVLGWDRKTKDGHSNSASGHLLVYLLKHGLLRDEEKRKLMESM